MRISDWSSDVCSSDLAAGSEKRGGRPIEGRGPHRRHGRRRGQRCAGARRRRCRHRDGLRHRCGDRKRWRDAAEGRSGRYRARAPAERRSEEHTSELQSLMRISYAVFCLKKKKKQATRNEENDKIERDKISENGNTR